MNCTHGKFLRRHLQHIKHNRIIALGIVDARAVQRIRAAAGLHLEEITKDETKTAQGVLTNSSTSQ